MSAVPAILAVVAALLAVGFFVAGVRALRRRRAVVSAVDGLVGILLLLCAGLLGVITIATTGYRALTREELAATVEVVPTGPHRFEARLELPDGTRDTFDLAGDQVYLDAHILKWKSAANLLGLHTAYELDRIGGRYADIGSELVDEKTVYSLKKSRPAGLDMFALAREVLLFEPLLDAEYGSGTFQRAARPAVYEVYVSTTGLLIRPAGR
ncbi:MAG: hypothetical protein ACODAA_04325 [Gemmatimonadota bacterium]